MRYWIALATTLMLAGCAGGSQVETAATPPKVLEPYPVDWRPKVAAYVKASWKDPASIRDAEISAPTPELPSPFAAGMRQDPRWVVCVSLNARNSFGGYVGRTMYYVLIRDGQVLGAQPARDMGPTCDGVKLEPFREVNGKGSA